MIKRYEDRLVKINKKIDEIIAPSSVGDSTVYDAMRYSVEAGGKRIRPLLCTEFCRMSGGNEDVALNFACAVELVHTYSLIHDDLPCMDDDDLRRGKPSCHIRFGEAYALLAGDALLTLAFKTISDSGVSDNLKCRAVGVLSECAGYNGMIGGQTLDLKNENKNVTVDEIMKTDYLKTSKLIESACVLGVLAANGSDEQIKAAVSYAQNMGIAFQITDDILDVTANEAVLGKRVGSDNDNNKSTYVSLLGIKNAKSDAREYSDKALEALNIFGEKSYDLKNFTNSLLQREN